MDVEGSIYKYCRTIGITLFTVTVNRKSLKYLKYRITLFTVSQHRKSLWAYHDYVLHMDGRGDYSIKEIDHDKPPEFGS